jgi:hypothetical protein
MKLQAQIHYPVHFYQTQFQTVEKCLLQKEKWNHEPNFHLKLQQYNNYNEMICFMLDG